VHVIDNIASVHGKGLMSAIHSIKALRYFFRQGSCPGNDLKLTKSPKNDWFLLRLRVIIPNEQRFNR
jgi:hypothetical protein